MKLLALLRRPPSCLLSPPSLFSPSLGGRLSDPRLTAALLRSQIKWKSQRHILGSPNPALTTPGDLTGWGGDQAQASPQTGEGMWTGTSHLLPRRLVEQDLGVEEADGLGIPPSKAPRRTRSHSLGGDGPLSPPTPDHVQPPQCPLPKALSGTTDQDVFPFLMALSPAQPRSPSLALKGLACDSGPQFLGHRW